MGIFLNTHKASAIRSVNVPHVPQQIHKVHRYPVKAANGHNSMGEVVRLFRFPLKMAGFRTGVGLVHPTVWPKSVPICGSCEAAAFNFSSKPSARFAHRFAGPAQLVRLLGCQVDAVQASSSERVPEQPGTEQPRAQGQKWTPKGKKPSRWRFLLGSFEANLEKGALKNIFNHGQKAHGCRRD